MVNLRDKITIDCIVDIKSTDKTGAILELAEAICRTSVVADKREFIEAILEREKILSTGIGIGIAVPHAKLGSIRDIVIAIGRKPEGIEFDSLDGKPVFVIVMIGANRDDQHGYLQVLAKVSRLFKEEEVRNSVLAARGREEILSLFDGA